MLDRLGMKNDVLNNNNIDPLTDVDPIDKDQAIQIIERIITANPKDKAIIKDLMPRLSELKDWKREQVSTKSNVLMYELPTKKLSR
jgi:hypothetical protein